MRDLTKALLRYSWATSLFGLRQMARMADPRLYTGGEDEGAVAAFDSVARTTEEQLGESLRQAFRAGDQLGGRMVDTFFGAAGAAVPAWSGRGGAADRRGGTGGEALPGGGGRPTGRPGTGRWIDAGPAVPYPGAPPAGGRPADGGAAEPVRFRAVGVCHFAEDGRLSVEATAGGEVLNVVVESSFLAQPENANRWYQWFDQPQLGPLYDPFAADHRADPTAPRATAKVTLARSDGSVLSAEGPAQVNLARRKSGPSLLFLGVQGLLDDGGIGGVSVTASAELPIDAGFDPGTSFAVTASLAGEVVRRDEVAVAPAAWSYSFDTIEVSAKDGRRFQMSYVEVGSGEPIVFLHGNPNWSYTWRNIFPHLEPLGRCLSPDLIGMGPDPTPDEAGFGFLDHIHFVDQFIEKKGLRNITFVLHDWGSAIGFDYAMRHEDNVRALLFMEAVYKSYPTWEAFPEPDAPALVRQNFRAFREGYPSKDSLGYEMIVRQNVFLDVLTPVITGRALTDEEMVWLKKPYQSEVNREVIWRWVNEIPIAGQPPAITALVDRYHQWLLGTDLPKLLIYTVPGMIVTAESVRWLETNLKNLTSVNAGSGLHYPHETNPELVGRAMADFVRALPR